MLRSHKYGCMLNAFVHTCGSWVLHHRNPVRFYACLYGNSICVLSDFAPVTRRRMYPGS